MMLLILAGLVATVTTGWAILLILAGAMSPTGARSGLAWTVLAGYAAAGVLLLAWRQGW